MRHVRLDPLHRPARITLAAVFAVTIVVAVVAGFTAGAPASGEGSPTGSGPPTGSWHQGGDGQSNPSAIPHTSPDSQLWIEIRNVTMHLDERATIRVRQLRGEVVSTSEGEPAVLDDSESFSIRVSSGSVALTGADLTKLLNDFIFAYRGAPLRNLRARAEAGHVLLSGTMRKGVNLPFEITSTIFLMPDGMIRLRPTRTRILGIDGQKLMRALGLHLDDLLDLNGSRGASVKGDDIYLDPTKILPPPAIVGRLAVAGTQGSEVVIEFADTPADSVFGSLVRPDSATPNFVYFRGQPAALRKASDDRHRPAHRGCESGGSLRSEPKGIREATHRRNIADAAQPRPSRGDARLLVARGRQGGARHGTSATRPSGP
ncbi:MAG TPA: hypothetical protein VMM18_17355 [Gemmatimonadaceae bacterium]|nr:hypothetical protein [Gemmatimonadaceae bacterium]